MYKRRQTKSVAEMNQLPDRVFQEDAWTSPALRLILDEMIDAFWALDDEFRILHLNRRALEFLSRPLEDVIGQSIWDVVPHIQDTPTSKAIERAAHSRSRENLEMFSPLINQWVHVEIAPVATGLYIYVRNTTKTHRQAEELRRVRESFDLALKGGRMGWWSRNLQTEEVNWSPELEELFGVGPDAFQSNERVFLQYVHPDHRRAVLKAVKHAIANGTDYTVQFRVLRPDGKESWIEGRGCAMYDDNGEALMLHGIGIDITDRMVGEVAASRSEKRLKLLLEASTVGIIVNHEDGRFIYANSPLLKMLGYNQEDIDMRRISWRDIQVPERLESDDRALAELRKYGVCKPYETEYVHKDGHRIPVYVGAAIMPEEGAKNVGAAFVTDLTELKKIQNELISWNNVLERKVAERTDELLAANDALKSFNYYISHDLRAPLRAIVSTSRLIEEDFGKEIPPGVKHHLKRQADAARKLGELIDDLLSFSRLSRQQISRKPVNLTEIARESAAQALAAHPSTKACVEVEDGLVGESDPQMLHLVMVNLIENAVKYSPEGGTIHVGRSDRGEFYVADEGIGFEPQYAERIFEAFQRLHRDDQYPGTGIGLANVKQVIERLNGKIWAEAKPNEGAVFRFTLD